MTAPRIDVLISCSDRARSVAALVGDVGRLGAVFAVASAANEAVLESARRAGASTIGAAGTPDERVAWALENGGLSADWVMFVDGDERVSARLVDEIRAAAGDAEDVAVLALRRRAILMGRLLRHGDFPAEATPRIVRRRAASDVEDRRPVHGRGAPRMRLLREPLLFVPQGTMSDYLRTVIAEAAERRGGADGLRPRTPADALAASTGRAPGRPLRPAWRFFRAYVLRMGFLDGAAGFHAAVLGASFEYMSRSILTETGANGNAASAVQTSS